MYVKVAEEGFSSSLMKLELNNNMTLSFTYLHSYFLGALGLKYKNDEGIWHGLVAALY
jgi:hypothetical protein